MSASSRVRQKQEQVLLELTATVDKLTGLDQVLHDIIQLTELNTDSTTDIDSRNIARKQERLLEELREWKSVYEKK
jgi:hypothetical protein